MKKRLLAIPALLTAVLVIPAHSASLNLGSRNLVSENNQNFNLSVNAGNQSYDNTGTLTTNPPLVTTALPPVIDYNFFHSPTETIASYASSGAGRISDGVSDAANINGAGENWSNVWTASDPGPNLVAPANPKDFNNGTVPNTFARTAEIDGTIDVTGLLSGTVHVPHGTFINQWTLTLTMSGPGQTDLVALDTQAVNGPGTNFGWISAFNFETSGVYDTIAYNYTNADRDGSRARFSGLILTEAVPEPSAVALFGLAGLGLILRRRR